MYCSQCGEKVAETTVFCSACGFKLNNTIIHKAYITDEIISDSPSPSGIGGWLILPLIGLILTPIFLVFSIITIYIPAVSNTILIELDQIQPGLIFVFYLELVGQILLMIFALFLLYLFIRKSVKLPTLIIAFYISYFIYIVLVNYVFVMQMPLIKQRINHVNNVMQMFFLIVWCLYFLRSKRVQNTFIN